MFTNIKEFNQGQCYELWNSLGKSYSGDSKILGGIEGGVLTSANCGQC